MTVGVSVGLGVAVTVGVSVTVTVGVAEGPNNAPRGELLLQPAIKKLTASSRNNSIPRERLFPIYSLRRLGSRLKLLFAFDEGFGHFQAEIIFELLGRGFHKVRGGSI